MDDRCAGAGGGRGDGGDGLDWLARPAWLAGIAASAAALLAQALLLLLVPRCRKYDEKILLQLTLARLSNSVSEYVTTDPRTRASSAASRECKYFFAMYTDFALVCFMFVFSKRLHERVVVVFARAGRWGAARAAAAVWAAAAAPAALGVALLHHGLYAAFTVYYKVYASVKFLVLIANAALFARILRVVFGRPGAPARAALVAFALVSLTSLQTLLSDLLTVFCGGYRALNNAFFVINAFQGVHVLAIFALVARGRARRASEMRARALTVVLAAPARAPSTRTELAADSTDCNDML